MFFKVLFVLSSLRCKTSVPKYITLPPVAKILLATLISKTDGWGPINKNKMPPYFCPCPENEAILSLPSPIIWAKRFFIRKVPVYAFSRKNWARCKMYVQVADNGENDLGTRVSRAAQEMVFIFR